MVYTHPNIFIYVIRIDYLSIIINVVNTNNSQTENTLIMYGFIHKWYLLNKEEFLKIMIVFEILTYSIEDEQILDYGA